MPRTFHISYSALPWSYSSASSLPSTIPGKGIRRWKTPSTRCSKMTNNRIQTWRRLAEAAQAVLLLGIPFFRIGGESALRFDIPSLRLHFFGMTLWMDEFFIVLIALFFFTFLIIFITQVFGRIWCGWLCPQTVIIDMTRFLDRAKV